MELAVQRAQDRALPADRQRVPATGGAGPGFGYPERARARGCARGGRGGGGVLPGWRARARPGVPGAAVPGRLPDRPADRPAGGGAERGRQAEPDRRIGAAAPPRSGLRARGGRRWLRQSWLWRPWLRRSWLWRRAGLPAGRFQGLPRPARARPPRAGRRPPDHDQLTQGTGASGLRYAVVHMLWITMG